MSELFIESQFRLRLWRMVAEQGKNRERKVHLMWKVQSYSVCGEFLFFISIHMIDGFMFNLLCFLLTQGIPSTCEEVNYMVKHMPYKGNTTPGNYTYTSCDSSSCDVNVDQNAHRLYLTVSVDDVLLAEDSVYVPAVGES